MNERDLIQKWIQWKEQREQKPFPQKTLAEFAGISPTYLSSIMTGFRNAGTKTIERIAEAFGVTLAEFYAGPSADAPRRLIRIPPDRSEARSPSHGPDTSSGNSAVNPDEKQMIRASGESPDETGLKLVHASPDQIDRLFGCIGYSLHNDADFTPADCESHAGDVSPEEFPEIPSNSGIPLLTRVPEGDWSGWFSDPGQTYRHIPLPFAGNTLFCVCQEDDSMAPALKRGALVVVDPGRPFSGYNGCIGVAAHKGRFLARRVYSVKESLVYVPSNPEHFPVVVPELEARVFTITLIIPDWNG